MEAARRAGERQAAPLALGTRYLLLTAAATAIAAAATWQRVLEMTPAQRRQLVETVFASADGDGEAGEGSSAGFRVDGRAPAAFDEAAAPVMFAIRVFFAELSSSRLGAMVRSGFCGDLSVGKLTIWCLGGEVADRRALSVGDGVPRVPGARTRLLWRDSPPRTPGTSSSTLLFA